MSHFYTPWKCQKTKGFLKFSGGKEMGHLREKGQFQKLKKGNKYNCVTNVSTLIYLTRILF